MERSSFLLLSTGTSQPGELLLFAVVHSIALLRCISIDDIHNIECLFLCILYISCSVYGILHNFTQCIHSIRCLFCIACFISLCELHSFKLLFCAILHAKNEGFRK